MATIHKILWFCFKLSKTTQLPLLRSVCCPSSTSSPIISSLPFPASSKFLRRCSSTSASWPASLNHQASYVWHTQHSSETSVTGEEGLLLSWDPGCSFDDPAAGQSVQHVEGETGGVAIGGRSQWKRGEYFWESHRHWVLPQIIFRIPAGLSEKLTVFLTILV